MDDIEKQSILDLLSLCLDLQAQRPDNKESEIVARLKLQLRFLNGQLGEKYDDQNGKKRRI